MRRRAFSLALAVAIGLIALSLLGGAAAGDSGRSNGAPKSLTHRFPLGSKTLSRTKTAPARSAATTPSRASATTPGSSSATTPRAAPAAPPRRHGTAPAPGGQTPGSIPTLALLALIPVLIAVMLLGRALIRRSRRTEPPDDRSPDAPVKRDPFREPLRFTGLFNGARYEDMDEPEVERKPPPLPVRKRAK